MSLLRDEPHAFNLFQAISILERGEPELAPVGTSVGMDEALRLSSQVDLAFAPSDITSLADSTQTGPALTLKSPALSLAGVHGPLPMPFTELLMERRRVRDVSGLDFLDIFNQRLLGFLYRSRRKHHLALSAGEVDRAPLVRSLDALSGLGRAEGARSPDGDQAWLRHAGVQGAAPRSMASLLAVLRDRMGVHFSGRQFVGGWHPLALCDRARLHDQGRPASVQARLGMGACLGARAWDQGAGMALSTPPLAPARFASLLPGGRDNTLLGWLVARHLQSAIQIELTLVLAARPETRLTSAPASSAMATAAAAPGAASASATSSAPASAPGPQSASASASGEALAPRLGLSAWLCGQPGAASAAAPAHYQQPRFLLATDAEPERN
ncbi:type VI secretion system baseplate subunit TssG [Duganella sp. SAP-35]|uniref:Type VI secretion system baseplate subunit TssG n=2 Tax=Duganella aceris TaxID=2703883 RepID=A0ABX0FND3_9BURK|nr:type VI secretion system baseplate subunit TssG [Duganella aceris]